MNVGDFAEAVAQYCALTGGSTTSGIRTARHNRQVGGVTHSAHRYARGQDVVYDKPVEVKLADETAARLGLRVIREGDHDHLQPVDWKAG